MSLRNIAPLFWRELPRFGWCLILAACLPTAVGARAAALAQLPPPPRLTQPVSDFANVIDSESARELDRRIRALQEATGDTVVVTTVGTFAPYADIREYAVKMFENGGAGIGDRSKDNGLLLVAAIDDRQVAIEVGYGLEGIITDGFAGQTIRESIRPEFRKGAYGRGFLAGATRIINRIAEERNVTLENVPRSVVRREAPVRIPIGTIILAIVILLLIARSSGRHRRHRRWGGGPWSGWNSGVGPFGGGFGGGFGGFGGGGTTRGGGGFGGFGGGRSGGGGAAGGW